MALRSTVMTARRLRRAMTPPEVKLWQYLRTRPGGFRFRRQHPIGRYVVDFYCPAARLVVEVDGAIHEQPDHLCHDEIRGAWLETQRMTVLRVRAADVLAELDSVSRMILHACSVLPLHQPMAGPPPHAVHGEDAC